MQKFIITLVFEKNTNYFLRKLSKIVENCDHKRVSLMNQFQTKFTDMPRQVKCEFVITAFTAFKYLKTQDYCPQYVGIYVVR
jgi:hypothetical protein